MICKETVEKIWLYLINKYKLESWNAHIENVVNFEITSFEGVIL